jgi:hypothetical protein
MPNIPVATVPGHTGVQSKDELRRNILSVTMDNVVKNLLGEPAKASEEKEPGARDVIFRGGFDEVNRYFYEHELSDGLPIVPPTRERVEQFLRCTDRDSDEVLGIVLPDNRAASIWSIAVNGVMAGCRPEYMPVLIALVEAMADPYYGVEHSGNTPGGETLIGAWLQLHTRGDARRLPAEHIGGPVLAFVSAQRRGVSAAQERQGDIRKHMARRRRRERRCCEGARLGTEQRRHGLCGRR